MMGGSQAYLPGMWGSPQGAPAMGAMPNWPGIPSAALAQSLLRDPVALAQLMRMRAAGYF